MQGGGSLERIENEGAQAHERGRPFTENPYTRNTPDEQVKAYCWAQGWVWRQEALDSGFLESPDL